MKSVILAGGLGTRLSEETIAKPKPMVEIGEKPILWHIMKTYAHYGINEFIICLGYKGYMIKEYFAHYLLHQSDVTIDLASDSIKVHNSRAEDWKITLVDTGMDTMVGGRIKRIQKYVQDEDFMLTYGDGLADVDIDELLKFHSSHKRFVTVTAVQPLGRFGAMDLSDDNEVLRFEEKPSGDGSWINGGFFVLRSQIFDYIDGDDTVWERECMSKLAADSQVAGYKHNGFWRPMDTLRDKRELESLWGSGNAPWKKWN